MTRRYAIRSITNELLLIDIGDILNVRLSRRCSQWCLVRSVRTRPDGSVKSIRVVKWLENKQKISEVNTVFPHEVHSVADAKFIPPMARLAFTEVQQVNQCA